MWKQLAKGVEVAWHKLNAEQRRAMAEAKQMEIKEWVASKVVQAAIGPVMTGREDDPRWIEVLEKFHMALRWSPGKHLHWCTAGQTPAVSRLQLALGPDRVLQGHHADQEGVQPQGAGTW